MRKKEKSMYRQFIFLTTKRKFNSQSYLGKMHFAKIHVRKVHFRKYSLENYTLEKYTLENNTLEKYTLGKYTLAKSKYESCWSYLSEKRDTDRVNNLKV